MSFARAVGLGLAMASVILLVGGITQFGRRRVWHEIDLMPLGPGEVLTALSAVATATIALQVMAQTAHSRPSRTLAEFNHRQNMGMLALSSPIVSCMLALFVWLDADTRFPEDLPYAVVVVALACMNCYIAADAADRIIRVDDENAEIQVAATRKVLGHYRRHRLPAPPPSVGTRVWEILGLSAATTFTQAALTGTLDWVQWPLAFLSVSVATWIIQAAAAVTAVEWAGTDRFTRWFSATCFALLLLMIGSVISFLDSGSAWVRIAVVLGVPTVIALASLGTRNSRTRWLLPVWLPGTWPREQMFTAVSKATAKTTVRLQELKKKTDLNRPTEPTVGTPQYEANSTKARHMQN